ncbi:CHAT domain-containing protein [Plantactinospora soyae]|uniref:CHAT domain-containing protein n=1 Tax=Plantactinospora soyae TaxID=1544732 RepID=A0A927R2B6_9ACTN|nr:CHAT domain-containing protein [Plantactinospora soyae]MBE1484394.1 CHAT domain-containing protein [Plantactinospora soyae]
MSDNGPDALTGMIARTSAVMAAEPESGRAAWAFARCWLQTLRFEDHGHDPGALRAALDDFDVVAPALPGRAKLAAMLVNAQIRAGVLREGPSIRRAAALAEIADADDRPLPNWPATRAVIRALTLLQLCQDGDATVSAHSALAELSTLDAVVAGQQPHAEMLDLARFALTSLRAQQNLDHAGMSQAAAQAEAIGRRHGPGSPLHGRARVLEAAAAAQAAIARGDIAAVTAAVEQIRSYISDLAPDHPTRRQSEQLLASVEPFLALLRQGPTSAGAGVANADAFLTHGGPVPPPLDAGLAALRRQADEPGLDDLERAMRLSTLGTAEAAYGPAAPHVLDEGVRHLAEAVATAPAHDARLPFYRMSHGYALIQRYELARRPADLTDGIRVLEQARALADSPAHPYWAVVSQMLGHAHRLAGARQRGRGIALEGLRGHAWSVLLQAHTAAATAAARDAAGDAIDVARWCLQDNAPGEAVTALDAGRGLIVYAATQIRGVADQLDEHHPQLAGRWRQATAQHAPGDVGIDLRREVLSALAGISGGPAASRRLLDPPSLHELRAALVALGVDALVYLVPGDQGTGAAVMVPAREEPAWRPLPLLTGEAMTEFDVRPSRNRDADLDDGLAVAGLPSVDEVCTWAWDAGIGPVLEMLDLPADGSGRIVLIPMRELARVPWHAARHRVGGCDEYAIQRAGFSYAASARLICDSAWAGDVAVSKTGLIVGDPDTASAARALPAARAEALAVRDAFYPPARYVGRLETGSESAAGPGDRRDVLNWLADPGGGTMLHLACHAVVDSGVGADDSAYLLLADGERLSAEDMVRALTGRAGRDIALATLAACSTGVSSRGYDEAFSLATTFLASGVRSVVSSQWAIPDEATSVLMFAFHHFLQTHSGGPAQALREAQLWMLSERRPELDGMPPELQKRMRGMTLPEIADWAGFVHSGR